MNYKVLYRKYRPKTFDEIVGQNNIITLLKDSIINNKISHAYIFSGPRGTGKTSTAKIFAKAINCLNNTDGNPCLNCDICSNFNLNNDIYEIDAASNTGVDQIREIIDNVKLSPLTSKYKVYIIDEVHMLSTSAFNALLLSLEEPPSHVVFILATTNIEDVPITVLSRCQRLDFRKIANKDIHEQLKKVSKEEIKSLIFKNEDAIIKMYQKAVERKKYNESYHLLGKTYNVEFNESINNVFINGDFIYAKNEDDLNKFTEEEINRVFNEEVSICKNCFNNLPEFTLKFRQMKTRWGVCNRRDNIITLNKELIKKEVWLLDYVIIHEMAHFYEGNHSKKFWNIVSLACPNYKEARKELRK